MSITENCQKLKSNLDEAIGWASSNKDIHEGDKEHLIRSLGLARVEAERLVTASRAPMSAGVYGQSQVGKSYMVSMLGRPQGEDSLYARLGNETVNFIEDINPSGDKESTGVVTRFTILEDGHQPLPGYPVQIKLLTQHDLIRILIDTYFHDSGHNESKPLKPEDVEEAFEKVGEQQILESGAVSANSSAPYNRIEAYELSTYVSGKYSGKISINVLSTVSYWDRFIEIAPGLDIEKRAILLSLLWGNIEQFTGLFLQLYDVLAKLQFAESVYASADALLPREAGITDVATLYWMLSGGSDSVKSVNTGQSVSVSREIGLKVGAIEISVPRGKVSALTSKLVILCEKKAWKFQDTTDVLDFPGARARLADETPDAEESMRVKPEGLVDFFLRGKVSYLFEKYCNSYELNFLLLMIKPGNQEVKVITPTVETWIKTLQGETPEERGSQQACTLFFIIARCDELFTEKSGEKRIDGKVKTAVETALLTPFAGADRLGWVDKWDTHNPFRNAYFFRNAQVKAHSLYDFSKNSEGVDIEVGLRNPKTLEEVKTNFLSDKAVNRYFKAPGDA